MKGYFHVKIQLLVLKSQIRIRIGLAPWIRIRFGLTPWIRIRIETKADPQHCFLCILSGESKFRILGKNYDI
jgi:hypothetical protein